MRGLSRNLVNAPRAGKEERGTWDYVARTEKRSVRTRKRKKKNRGKLNRERKRNHFTRGWT